MAGLESNIYSLYQSTARSFYNCYTLFSCHTLQVHFRGARIEQFQLQSLHTPAATVYCVKLAHLKNNFLFIFIVVLELLCNITIRLEFSTIIATTKEPERKHLPILISIWHHASGCRISIWLKRTARKWIDINGRSIFAMHTHNDQEAKTASRSSLFICVLFFIRPRLAIRNRYKCTPEFCQTKLVAADQSIRALLLHASSPLITPKVSCKRISECLVQCSAASLPRSPITYTSSFCITK